uniref:Ig-like domain-containing protein n=1 Tax=Anopheles culicifacies TaxID=139723 RepID=A0A182LVT5_9DIPT
MTQPPSEDGEWQSIRPLHPFRDTNCTPNFILYFTDDIIIEATEAGFPLGPFDLPKVSDKRRSIRDVEARSVVSLNRGPDLLETLPILSSVQRHLVSVPLTTPLGEPYRAGASSVYNLSNRTPTTGLDRITSAASSVSLHHASSGTSTASSSSGSAAALVAGGLSSPSSSLTGPAEKPYFDDVNSRNVTTVVDDTAVLKCRVKHKGDRTVGH